MFEVRPYKLNDVITEPGCYSGVPIDTYHNDPSLFGDEPSISSSGLRTILRHSPAMYWDNSPYNPNRKDKKESDALIVGRAAHHLFLGEGEFNRSFVIRPEHYMGSKWNGNRNDCKAWLAEQEMKRLTVLTGEMAENIVGMAKSLAEHDFIKAGILSGLIEHSIFWRDKKTGVWLKTRPDSIPLHALDVGDLKKTQSVDEDAIERTLGEYEYPTQMALVRQGFREVLNIDVATLNLIFVEEKRPHCVRVVEVDGEDLNEGDDNIRIALDVFKKCWDEQHWWGPAGRADTARKILKPTWAKKKTEWRREQLKRELQ